MVGEKSVDKEAGDGEVSVESGKRAAVAGLGVLGRSRTTLSGRGAGIQEKRMSFSGSRTQRLWYADAGRQAKKELVVYVKNA